MTDRTTLNIDKEEHKATREVKEEYDDSWTDVLQFYREHRHELSLNNGDVNTTELESEIDKLQELVEQIPERSAELFGTRYK